MIAEVGFVDVFLGCFVFLEALCPGAVGLCLRLRRKGDI